MYPYNGSNTCCHGLTDWGFLKSNFFLLSRLRKKSGIILFSEKSPPPIILPALAVTANIFFLLKKELLNELTINSVQAFELLYGS